MKLKYNHNGETNGIEFTADQTTPKPRAAIYHNGQTWYVPCVSADSSNASSFTFWHNGEHLALSNGRDISKMLTYNNDHTAVTLNGSAQVASDSTKSIFSGDLLVGDIDSSTVTIVAAAGANNGEPITINANGNYIMPNTDVFIDLAKGSNTVGRNDTVSVTLSHFGDDDRSYAYFLPTTLSSFKYNNDGIAVFKNSSDTKPYLTIHEPTATTTETALFKLNEYNRINACLAISKTFDGGVLTNDDGTPNPTLAGPGQEYYPVLFSIVSAQNDSTLNGNSQSNYIYVKGGTKNVLTGGIGKDYFIFNSGGGLIRDFGGGATKHKTKDVMAGETTQELEPLSTVEGSAFYLAYNRFDPSTYKESTDVLQVNGVVKAIAYEGYGDPNTGYESETNPHNKFYAYVIYTADNDGKDYVIKLDNIYKQPVAFGENLRYRTDDYIAERFKIWDTRNGSMAAIDLTANADLLKTVADSGYSDKIAEFELLFDS